MSQPLGDRASAVPFGCRKCFPLDEENHRKGFISKHFSCSSNLSKVALNLDFDVLKAAREARNEIDSVARWMRQSDPVLAADGSFAVQLLDDDEEEMRGTDDEADLVRCDIPALHICVPATVG